MFSVIGWPMTCSVSENTALRNPVMPVADRFPGRSVRTDGLQLRQRNDHLPPLPTDLHKHVMLARILSGIRKTSTVSPFLSGEIAVAARHFARKGNLILFSR
jgi:hypothetical protein